MVETIMAVWEWIKLHYADILTVWIGIIGVAEVVVKWTDSKKDDEVVGKIRAIGVKVISWLTKFGLEQPKK